MKSRKNVDWRRDRDITIDEVKRTEGLKKLTDEEAQEIVDVIKIYCQCIYSIYEREKKGEIDLEATILDLDKTQTSKKAA